VAKESAQGGLAKRYAHALFELAQDGNAVDAVSADLASLRRATEASADLRRLVRSPVFSAEDQAKALKAILDKMGANALTTKFVLLLSQKRRLPALTQIVQAYEHLIATTRRRGRRAQICSQVPAGQRAPPAFQSRSHFARRSRRQGRLAHDRFFASHQAGWPACGHERVRSGL